MNRSALLFPVSLFSIAVGMSGCNSTSGIATGVKTETNGKIIIYQAFTRLFGNKDTTNKPWGTIEENGVGKFADFTNKALSEIKALGVTHIWFTGIPHHALIRDYSSIGITNDDPDVVKGRAGSPYAIKDYYNVNPDLATDPGSRLDEFKALISRTHANGLKVIIDIVPNHVARHYQSVNKPDGVLDFGATDDKTVVYSRNNDFYYIPGEDFEVPESKDGYKALGGEPHPLSDGKFEEKPAKWTGNGSRLAKPHINDWYETVKINYGVRPDGTRDFDTLPDDFQHRSLEDHYMFWVDKQVPGSWKKFRDIALYWLEMGVDGFRFDMAEMVPVEFWSYMNSAIKQKYPTAVLIAEVYNPEEYRNYIRFGKLDYLYDKVGLYDSLKPVIQGHGSTDNLADVQERIADIEHHMLHFLENHDEQRIASAAFAGDPYKALPAMVLSATISTSPTLVYFGQEVGEPGAEVAGFGSPTRTSIFDYIGVPHHQRWMNGGKFDGGLLSATERSLRDYYKKLLNITLTHPALTGNYAEIHRWNRQHTPGYSDKLYSFVRWNDNGRILVICNFSHTESFNGEVRIPAGIIDSLKFKDGSYRLKDELNDEVSFHLHVAENSGRIQIHLAPLQSVMLSIKE